MFGKRVGKPINESRVKYAAGNRRDRACQKLVFYLYRVVPRAAHTRNQPEVVTNAECMFPQPSEQGPAQIRGADPDLAASPASHIRTIAGGFALQNPVDLVTAPGQLHPE